MQCKKYRHSSSSYQRESQNNNAYKEMATCESVIAPYDHNEKNLIAFLYTKGSSDMIKKQYENDKCRKYIIQLELRTYFAIKNLPVLLGILFFIIIICLFSLYYAILINNAFLFILSLQTTRFNKF